MQEESKKLATQIIKPENYGDEVEYSANGITDWKVFLNDGTHIYIIATDYVPSNKLDKPSEIKSGDDPNCVWATDITELFNWLVNPIYWERFAQTFNDATAMGGPTNEQFNRSYQDKYGTDSSVTNSSDILYNPHLGEIVGECKGYWLAELANEGTKIWLMHCVDKRKYLLSNFYYHDVRCTTSCMFTS